MRCPEGHDHLLVPDPDGSGRMVVSDRVLDPPAVPVPPQPRIKITMTDGSFNMTGHLFKNFRGNALFRGRNLEFDNCPQTPFVVEDGDVQFDLDGIKDTAPPRRERRQKKKKR
jgi:hypothetical protein